MRSGLQLVSATRTVENDEKDKRIKKLEKKIEKLESNK